MHKICVVTGSRAEYHLLVPTMKRIEASEDLELSVVVTGSHLSEPHGYTVREIENDGFPIDCRIPILGADSSSSAIVYGAADELKLFCSYLDEANPDVVIVLGDRYEIVPPVYVSFMKRIPVVHLHGGEKTSGALDDGIRHAVSKLSSLHFVSCETHRNRLLQMGEGPNRVYNVGACGIENIVNTDLMERGAFFESVHLDPSRPFFLFTFHPTTLSAESSKSEISVILAAMDRYRDHSILFTKANADEGGDAINEAIEQYAVTRKDCVVESSLGMLRYLSALNYADAVVGNSSSGLLEAPSFRIPTVNIGDRQSGRERCGSVIDCSVDGDQVCRAIDTALSGDFKEKLKDVVNPYGDGRVSERIIRVLEEFLKLGRLEQLRKEFVDLFD